MKKEPKDRHFLKIPQFKGGPKAMQKFLSEKKRYPPAALEAKIEGTVSIRFTIDYQGNVIKTKILSGLGFGCDEEAVRVVSILKFTVPKTRRIKAQYHKTVHLHFRLPESPASLDVQYHVTTLNKESAKTHSYQYQIRWDG